MRKWQIAGFFATYCAILGLSCATMQRIAICAEPALEQIAVEIANCMSQDFNASKETCAGVAALKVFTPWLACTWREHIEGRHVKNCPYDSDSSNRDGGGNLLPPDRLPDGGLSYGKNPRGSVFSHYTVTGLPVLDKPASEGKK